MLKLEVLGVSPDPAYQPVVLLRHEDRVLPIVVGVAEADAILAALTKRNIGRPMTHDLICNLLAGLRGKLLSVTIYKLERDTFYAYLEVQQHDINGELQQALKIDTRPSDGIAIALRVDCPIMVAPEVMDQAAQDMSNLTAQEEPDDSPDENDFE
ncbi:MAG: bifunctional nuclease family protein [FCB group bacterium]|jgi:bifunctional DNase/RNase|nr:bifunctional nuclease family protein [FCB group bacterium]